MLVGRVKIDNSRAGAVGRVIIDSSRAGAVRRRGPWKLRWCNKRPRAKRAAHLVRCQCAEFEWPNSGWLLIL